MSMTSTSKLLHSALTAFPGSTPTGTDDNRFVIIFVSFTRDKPFCVWFHGIFDPKPLDFLLHPDPPALPEV